MSNKATKHMVSLPPFAPCCFNPFSILVLSPYKPLLFTLLLLLFLGEGNVDMAETALKTRGLKSEF